MPEAFAVDTGPLESAGSSLKRCGTDLVGLAADLVGAFAELAAASVDVGIAEAAWGAGRRWGPVVATGGAAVAGLGVALTAAASAYERVEAAAVSRLGVPE